MSKIIGIDLGTTNSVVAVMEGGTARRYPQPGRWPDDSVCSRHSQRTGSAWPDRLPSGTVTEPGEHDLFDQAVHGTAL